MRDLPVWDCLHASEAASLGPPPLSDYPISLLTRRTLGELAGGILADRQFAPQGMPLRTAVVRPRNV